MSMVLTTVLNFVSIIFLNHHILCVASVEDSELRHLSSTLDGNIILPADSEFATKKQVYWEIFNDQNPRAIAYPHTVDDLTKIAKFHWDSRFPFVVRSGGHSYGGYSQCDSSCVVVDMSAFNSIDMRSDNEADVGSAVTVGELAKFNLVPHASCPTVALGGLIQGGGIGFLTQKFGLTSDYVTKIYVMMNDGQAIWVTPTRFSDLFRALRGSGGGNWGIVIKYRLKRKDDFSPMSYNYHTGKTIWKLDADNLDLQMDAAFKAMDDECSSTFSCQLTLKPNEAMLQYQFELKYVNISKTSESRQRRRFREKIERLEELGENPMSEEPQVFDSPSDLYKDNLFEHCESVHDLLPLSSKRVHIVPVSRLSYEKLSSRTNFKVALKEFLCVYASLVWDRLAFVLDVQPVKPKKLSDVEMSSFAARDAMYTVQFYAHALSGSAEHKRQTYVMASQMEKDILSELNEKQAQYINYISRPTRFLYDEDRFEDVLYRNPATFDENFYRELQCVKAKYDSMNFFRFDFSVWPFPWDPCTKRDPSPSSGRRSGSSADRSGSRASDSERTSRSGSASRRSADSRSKASSNRDSEKSAKSSRAKSGSKRGRSKRKKSRRGSKGGGSYRGRSKG